MCDSPRGQGAMHGCTQAIVRMEELLTSLLDDETLRHVGC